MPNYCNNNIVITGPNSVIDKIEKIANGDKGDLSHWDHTTAFESWGW